MTPAVCPTVTLTLRAQRQPTTRRLRACHASSVGRASGRSLAYPWQQTAPR
jgi:hypothetical protein